MSDLFAVNAPIKWADPGPLTRESLRRAVELYKQQVERERAAPPRPRYVTRPEFEEYVALGICDRQGRFL